MSKFLYSDEGSSALQLIFSITKLPNYPFTKLSPAPFGQQICPDKWPEVAVQNAVYIANLRLGAVIFYQPVGMQHIRPNLRAEVDIEL